MVVFPNNLTVAMETGVHPILEAEHRMHFKRKVIMPNSLGHRLEWRFYVRRKGRTKQNRQIEKVGQKLRVMPHFSRHANMHESHEDGYKGKALMVCSRSVSKTCPSLLCNYIEADRNLVVT